MIFSAQIHAYRPQCKFECYIAIIARRSSAIIPTAFDAATNCSLCIAVGFTRSHGSVCCKDDQLSQWKMLNFDPATTHEPLKRSSPNLAHVITSWIGLHPTKKKMGSIR